MWKEKATLDLSVSCLVNVIYIFMIWALLSCEGFFPHRSAAWRDFIFVGRTRVNLRSM